MVPKTWPNVVAVFLGEKSSGEQGGGCGGVSFPLEGGWLEGNGNLYSWWFFFLLGVSS